METLSENLILRLENFRAKTSRIGARLQDLREAVQSKLEALTRKAGIVQGAKYTATHDALAFKVAEIHTDLEAINKANDVIREVEDTYRERASLIPEIEVLLNQQTPEPGFNAPPDLKEITQEIEALETDGIEIKADEKTAGRLQLRQESGGKPGSVKEAAEIIEHGGKPPPMPKVKGGDPSLDAAKERIEGMLKGLGNDE